VGTPSRGRAAIPSLAVCWIVVLAFGSPETWLLLAMAASTGLTVDGLVGMSRRISRLSKL